MHEHGTPGHGMGGGSTFMELFALSMILRTHIGRIAILIVALTILSGF